MVNARRGRPRRDLNPQVSERSVARSRESDRVEDSVGAASSERVTGGANSGYAGGSGAGGAGEGAPGGGDQHRMGVDRLEELLTRILERLPAVEAQGAPRARVRAEEQPRVVGVGEQSSYLEMMKQMQKLGSWFFSGDAKPEEAEEWRSRMERNFQSLRCPTEHRVDIAVHYLRGDAHLWWEGVATRRVVEDMEWEDFVEEFDSKYFPQEALDRLQARFLDLSQGSRTVREYEIEFNRLKRYGGRGLDDERTI